MQRTEEQEKQLGFGLWLLVYICTGAVVFTLACGAAYSGIQNARIVAAKASLGQIESVLLLAEKVVQDAGMQPPEGSFNGMLSSYDNSANAELTSYERSVLDLMLQSFGDNRDFDFSITRYEDGGGLHTYVYYFPVRGQTDLSHDNYYLMRDSQFSVRGE